MAMFQDRRLKNIQNNGRNMKKPSDTKAMREKPEPEDNRSSDEKRVAATNDLIAQIRKQKAEKGIKEVAVSADYKVGPDGRKVHPKRLEFNNEEQKMMSGKRAKKVVHEDWGIGEVLPNMHAAPDAVGNIGWYDVMFEHGIEQHVSADQLKIVTLESFELDESFNAEILEEGYKEQQTKYQAAANQYARKIAELTAKLDPNYDSKYLARQLEDLADTLESRVEQQVEDKKRRDEYAMGVASNTYR